MGGWWFLGFLVLCLAIGIPTTVHMMRADARRGYGRAAGGSTPPDPVEARRQTPGGGSPLPGA